MVDRMKPGDAAMIVSFSDGARVVQLFTQQRSQLRRSLAKIEPTQRPTNLREAQERFRNSNGLDPFGDQPQVYRIRVHHWHPPFLLEAATEEGQYIPAIQLVTLVL